jgi:hypothetical protein
MRRKKMLCPTSPSSSQACVPLLLLLLLLLLALTCSTAGYSSTATLSSDEVHALPDLIALRILRF